MKKLGKLEINSERILKNEELLNLKGGENVKIDCGNGCTIDGVEGACTDNVFMETSCINICCGYIDPCCI